MLLSFPRILRRVQNAFPQNTLTTLRNIYVGFEKVNFFFFLPFYCNYFLMVILLLILNVLVETEICFLTAMSNVFVFRVATLRDSITYVCFRNTISFVTMEYVFAAITPKRFCCW